MALKSTVFKAELQVSDLDRHYYETHALTLLWAASRLPLAQTQAFLRYP